MASLYISEFCCLKSATFQLAPINIIIGPQGSGKSITTKLFYFFSDILVSFVQAAERGDSLEDYKKSLSKQFALWFPPSAWGGGRFNITYTAGLFSVRVLRRTSGGRVADDVAIKFSDWFMGFYKATTQLFTESIDQEEADITSNVQVTDALDKLWRVRSIVSRRMLNDLSGEYIGQQTFIPAGRAFFTSIGRLVAGFEQASSLDPVTIKFARLFANVRDRNAARSVQRLHRLGTDALERRSHFMNELFGGEVKFENDTEFVETEDGRRVPFTSLSSGQQELLPMWSLMDYFAQLDAGRNFGPNRPSRRARELVYIEEPEAHLFPSAQSLLMEFLIGSVASEKNRRNLIITTHSPYIMSKLNVFLKAGQLSRRRRKNQEIGEIVPRDCWITSDQLSAFAIEDGSLHDILDEDGMIDGTYLDQISEDNAYQFSQLLQVETTI